MAQAPEKLRELVASLALLEERDDRIQILIDMADRFRPVPDRVATRPYPAEKKVPGCESEVYVWDVDDPDGTVRFHFAVENPQGVSAMALAVLLADTLSGAPLEEIAAIDPEIVRAIFGNELSMGKSMGLTGMVAAVRTLARRRLAPGAR